MSGALDLAGALLRANRPREAQEVLRLTEARLPQSPQLAKLRALRSESERVATGTP